MLLQEREECFILEVQENPTFTESPKKRNEHIMGYGMVRYSVYCKSLCHCPYVVLIPIDE